jgi:hypothetical protein
MKVTPCLIQNGAPKFAYDVEQARNFEQLQKADY